MPEKRKHGIALVKVFLIVFTGNKGFSLLKFKKRGEIIERDVFFSMLRIYKYTKTPEPKGTFID